ncbi:Ger(x)C family spore germination protein [Gorillibacterium timonense]|uniref:Ger(x)C family spore germination protein n=1 Tax=Gorillibacterium timonense TaxID=1689269 RepID=UPI00071CEE41|nr:Ger(x)C family spore germination protein [Gorillibacterium timonense]
MIPFYWKKVIYSLLVASLLLFLPGCTFRDIDKRFFVVAVGFDESGNPQKPYKVTLKLAIPASHIEPGLPHKFQLVSEEAATISEAIGLIGSRVDKHLDFSQTKAFILGLKLMSRNIQNSLDWLVRRHDIQGIAYLSVGDPTAESVLKTSPPSERLPSNSLILIFGREGNNSSYIMPITVSEYYRRSTEKGLTPYMPIVRPSQGTYLVDQVALLATSKIELILTPEETRFLNQLTRQRMVREYSFHHGDESYSLEIKRMRYNYKLLRTPQGKLRHVAKIKASVMLQHTNSYRTQEWGRLEKLTQDHMAADYLKLMEKIRDSGTDPLGFGLRYRATHHDADRDWTQWRALYPAMDFSVQVDCTMRGTGIIK